MDATIKALWLEKLRSGEYEQGKGRLVDVTEATPKYCCLGVLCEVAREQGIVAFTGYRYTSEGYEDSYLLPYKVQVWAGLDEGNPTVINHGDDSNLAELNDGCGFSFKEIADVIEAQL